MSSPDLPTYPILHPWYVAYLAGWERLGKGTAPMQSLIFLVTMAMAACVTLEINTN